MRNPNIQNLVIFCLAAKHKSTRLVAKMLDVDISTITRNIKSLEDNLELTLMKREKHFIGLTPEGEMLYQQYRISISYYEDLMLATKNIHDEQVEKKEIKILLPMFGSEELLNESLFDILKDLFKEHNIFIDGLSAADVTNFPHMALQKAMSADILFIPEKLSEDLPEDFNAVFHYKDPFYLCGSTEYIRRHDINEKNFKKHIFCKVDEPFEKGCFKFLSNHKTKIKVDNSHKLSSLLQASYGISPMPIAPIRKLLEKGKLKIILTHLSSERNWFLARKVHKSKTLNNKLIEATEIMKQWIESYKQSLNHLI